MSVWKLTKWSMTCDGNGTNEFRKTNCSFVAFIKDIENPFSKVSWIAMREKFNVNSYEFISRQFSSRTILHETLNRSVLSDQLQSKLYLPWCQWNISSMVKWVSSLSFWIWRSDSPLCLCPIFKFSLRTNCYYGRNSYFSKILTSFLTQARRHISSPMNSTQPRKYILLIHFDTIVGMLSRSIFLRTNLLSHDWWFVKRFTL